MRQAEMGDTRLLFGYYRDFFLGSGLVAAELSKRKLSTISEPFTILPVDKTNKDDERAAAVITEAINRCPNFHQSLIHLMNAIVFPVSVVEKTFAPVEDDYGDNQYNLRYRIKELYSVDYNLLSYRLPYIPQGPINIGNQPVLAPMPYAQNLTGRPEDTIYDPDSWEPDLRFWSVFSNGLIDFSYANMRAPDPMRHMVYRCNLLQGMARENWGGLGRSLLWWTIMSQLGADKFLQCLQRYGLPFIVAKVDTSQVDTVDKIMKALDEARIVNALAVNKDAVVELVEMNMTNASEAHKIFMDFCNDQISLLICGQVLSSHARAQGIGGGASALQGQVREDIIKWDRLCLNDVLQHQLFRQYLDINGIKGNTPRIVWGGSSSSSDNKDLSITILNLANAGIAVSEDSMDDISTQLGFSVEKTEMPEKPLDEGDDDKEKNIDDDNSNKD
jgi:phage gp29-like protein